MATPIQCSIDLNEGQDREVQVLLSDTSRKLVLIQLRRGALLADHSARVPITIHAVAGSGTLGIGNETHRLIPGTIVPVDTRVVNNFKGDPAIAILVTFFRGGQAQDENDSTARFD